MRFAAEVLLRGSIRLRHSLAALAIRTRLASRAGAALIDSPADGQAGLRPVPAEEDRACQIRQSWPVPWLILPVTVPSSCWRCRQYWLDGSSTMQTGPLARWVAGSAWSTAAAGRSGVDGERRDRAVRRCWSWCRLVQQRTGTCSCESVRLQTGFARAARFATRPRPFS